MKQLFICAAILVSSTTITLGQNKKTGSPKKATNTNTAPAKPVMKNLNDSFSYAAGMNIATNMKDQGITSINTVLMAKAIDDVFAGKIQSLTAEQANTCLQVQMNIYGEAKKAEMDKKVAPERAKGEAFLAENKKRPGVITLPDGLQYEVIKAGEPNGIKPGMADTVVVNYAGKLIDGTEFDASRNEPITFMLTRVIKGWTEILQLMTKGDHWKVYIPTDLAYGSYGQGNAIPPGAALIFDMTLEDIKPAAVR